MMNWDYDDNDPDLDNRRLDLYVVYETDVDNTSVAPRLVNNFSGETYKWISNTHSNVSNSAEDFSYRINNSSYYEPAMWIFQDLRCAWEKMLQEAGRDAGLVTAKWENGQNTDIVPGSHFQGDIDTHIFIADNDKDSSDIVIHETAHNYLYNATGWWTVLEFGCYLHELFSQESAICAYSEGWADFYPLIVNNDQCYDYGIGSCGSQGMLL
jgi:hypothetical protein